MCWRVEAVKVYVAVISRNKSTLSQHEKGIGIPGQQLNYKPDCEKFTDLINLEGMGGSESNL